MARPPSGRAGNDFGIAVRISRASFLQIIVEALRARIGLAVVGHKVRIQSDRVRLRNDVGERLSHRDIDLGAGLLLSELNAPGWASRDEPREPVRARVRAPGVRTHRLRLCYSTAIGPRGVGARRRAL